MKPRRIFRYCRPSSFSACISGSLRNDSCCTKDRYKMEQLGISFRKGQSEIGLILFLIVVIGSFCQLLQGQESNKPDILYRRTNESEMDLLFAEKLYDRELTEMARSATLRVFNKLKTSNNVPDSERLRCAALLLRINTSQWLESPTRERAELDSQFVEIRQFAEYTEKGSKEFSSPALKKTVNTPSFENYLNALTVSAIQKGTLLGSEGNTAGAAVVLESALKTLDAVQNIPEISSTVINALQYYRIRTLQEAALLSDETRRREILVGIAQNFKEPSQKETIYVTLIQGLLIRNQRLLGKAQEAQAEIDRLYKNSPSQMTILRLVAEKIRLLAATNQSEEALRQAEGSFTELFGNDIPNAVRLSGDLFTKEALSELLLAQLEIMLASEKRDKTIPDERRAKIATVTDFLTGRSGTFYRHLAASFLQEKGGAIDLEKLAGEKYRSGKTEEAIALYDQASAEFRRSDKLTEAFRLAGTSAAILDKKLRELRQNNKSEKEVDELEKQVMTRFFNLAINFPQESTAEKIAEYGQTLADRLFARKKLTANEMTLLLTQRLSAFPNSDPTGELRLRTETIKMEQREKENGVPFGHKTETDLFLSALASVRQKAPNSDLLQRRSIRRYEAEAAFANGNDQLALNLFAALLRDFPNERRGYEVIALILEKQKDPKILEKALTFRNELVKRSAKGSPDWIQAKESVIRLYERLGKKEQADKMREILDLTYPQSTKKDPKAEKK